MMRLQIIEIMNFSCTFYFELEKILVMSLGRLRDIPEVPFACCVDGSVGVLDVSVSGISTPSG